MAVQSTNITAKLVLQDNEKKTICSFSDIQPTVDANNIALFAEAVESLIKEEVGFRNLSVETLLESV